MNTTQTIKAIPTKYNGILFRSRLEARWAGLTLLSTKPLQCDLTGLLLRCGRRPFTVCAVAGILRSTCLRIFQSARRLFAVTCEAPSRSVRFDRSVLWCILVASPATGAKFNAIELPMAGYAKGKVVLWSDAVKRVDIRIKDESVWGRFRTECGLYLADISATLAGGSNSFPSGVVRSGIGVRGSDVLFHTGYYTILPHVLPNVLHAPPPKNRAQVPDFLNTKWLEEARAQCPVWTPGLHTRFPASEQEGQEAGL